MYRFATLAHGSPSSNHFPTSRLALFLIGAGMVTAVGSTALSSCAAIRSGLAGFREVPYTDIQNAPVVGAPVQFIRSEFKGFHRLVDLAAPALIECAALIPSDEIAATALLLCVADASRPPLYPNDRLFLRSLQERTGLSFSSQSHVIPAGALSGVIALERAQIILATAAARYCIIGGVDTYLDSPHIRWLQRSQRLKRPNNPDGLIPGEAAGFVALGDTDPSSSAPVRVVGIGLVDSRRTAAIDGAVRGTDITSAMRTSLERAGVADKEIAFEVTDMTGERDQGVDHAIAVTRTFTESRPRLHYWHPAMSLGTVGAAALPCAMGLVWASAVGSYAPGSYAMCVSVSEQFGKGAAVLHIANGR